MTDPSRPDPAAALLAAMRKSHAEAVTIDPALAAWLGDYIAVTEKAIPLAGRSIRAGLKESAYLLNLRADEIEASRG